jgi:EAL domain-containing protein (putative c-di-GMP-specific phosphodiesterase class I)
MMAGAERILVDVPPLCFIVDPEEAHRRSVSTAMQSYGVETALFSRAHAMREALSRRTPNFVLLDVPPDPKEAIDAIDVLSERSYRGAVHLMSSDGTSELEKVRRIGLRSDLRVADGLHKPVDRARVREIVRDHRLDGTPFAAKRTTLEDALRNHWVEFWYQPKIDLRKKQLAGVELFARVRHPDHGVLLPAAFMDGAGEESLVALTEKSIVHALRIGRDFFRVGVNFRPAINVSMAALMKLPLPAIIHENRPVHVRWPGLIVDVSESQIAADLDAARDFTSFIECCGVQLGIDDFGQGALPLAALNRIPFTELKLHRSFIADCASDKKSGAICKTVIDLAHNFTAVAVAVGVETSPQAHSLFRMGCDLGQGYLFGQPMPEDRFLNLLRQRLKTSEPRLAVGPYSH